MNKNNQNLLSNDFNFQNQNINNQINYQKLESSLNNVNQTITPNHQSSNIETNPIAEIETLDLNNQDSVQNSSASYSNTQNQNINNQINYQNTASRLDGYTEPSTANIHNSVSNIQDDEDIEILDLDD